MAITKKELWQIAGDRARKELKFKETIWDNLFMNLMFFDITALFIKIWLRTPCGLCHREEKPSPSLTL